MSLPTIDEFLTWTFPLNSYVCHPGIKSLYVRSGRIGVIIDGEYWWCEPVLLIGSVDAEQPGNGAFTALVEFLVERNLAIYVENVHNVRFRSKLERMGFVLVNEGQGAPHYLFNFEGRLTEYEPHSI